MEMSGKINCYELLDLEEGATREDILKAYHFALSIYKEESIATYSILSKEKRAKILDSIKVAYNILNDEKERAEYDKSLFLRSLPKESQVKSDREKLSNDSHEDDKSINDHTFALSGGEYLKNTREIKQLSLREISEKTKIGMNFLTAIEEEKLNELPALIFVKGFIKAYAQCLGINPEDVLKRFGFSKLKKARVVDKRKKRFLY